MSKDKSQFSCAQCAYKTVKWLGCCPSCNTWDSFTEIATSAHKKNSKTKPAMLVPLSSVREKNQSRLLTGISEWDRVMGGGIMPSSLIMLTGDPGIGKSTLLLQVGNALSEHKTVFYFSTEESLEQVRLRSQRISLMHDTLLFSDNASLETIMHTVLQERPDVMILDSIQNCVVSNTQTIPGSISQLKEATFQLMRLAKENNITILMTGHITKEGVMAGPKTLEHMVDAVFYLQGEDRYDTRILRAVKNRFGTINELGFFSMAHDGLQQVPNINEHVVNEFTNAPGSCLVSIMEGSRPILVELQALTIESKLTMPQRVITGLNHKQVVLIAAILQKYLHIKFSNQDIFCKVAGGITIKESATDLGIALALLSSYFQQPLAEHMLALGEISLTGHIKPINHIQLFAREAAKFGIGTLLVAKKQKCEGNTNTIKYLENVYELLSLFEEN